MNITEMKDKKMKQQLKKIRFLFPPSNNQKKSKEEKEEEKLF